MRDADGAVLPRGRGGRDPRPGRSDRRRVRRTGARSPPTAGSARATAAGSTPTATCSSTAGRRRDRARGREPVAGRDRGGPHVPSGRSRRRRGRHPRRRMGGGPGRGRRAAPGPPADRASCWTGSGQLRSARTPVLLVESEALPYSEAGKLLRRELRDELAAEFGSETPRGLGRRPRPDLGREPGGGHPGRPFSTT